MEAVATARRAADESEREKAPRNESLANALLSQALLEQGKTAEARKAIERAAAILGKCHDRELELLVTITAARVRAASGSRADKAEAAKSLGEVAKEATKIGFANYGLEARLALGECELQAGNSTQGRADLKAVEKDARNKGFALIAGKAAVALGARSTQAPRSPTIPARK
jgi:ATP/maltotriose-dependent transcriptional regulator MalT